MKIIAQRSWDNLRWIAGGIATSKKWVMAYIFIIFIPASIMLYVYYEHASSILEEEVTGTMLETLKQAGVNLNYQFDNIKDISNSLFMNPNLYKYLGDSESIEQQYDAAKELRLLINSAEENTSVFQIRLFVDESKLFADEKINFFSLGSLDSRPWYKQVLAANGGIIWTGAYLETFIDDKKDTYLISGARMLHDLKQFGKSTGILLVDMSEQRISDILEKIQLSKQKSIYLLDNNGHYVAHQDKSLIGKSMESSLVKAAIDKSEEGIREIGTGDNAVHIVYTTIQTTGWKLVAEIPRAEILQRAVKLNQFSGAAILLGVTVLFLLLLFMLLAFLVKGINQRIKTILRAIHQEGMVYSSGGSDYNLLERSVDRLINKMKTMIEETYRAKMLEREAQLRALQAQINPHFLYNTLDTINWLAIKRDTPDISQMIEGLAKYFRLSLNKGRDVVSVSDELKLASVYLEIQQNRFPHSFDFHIVEEDQLQIYRVPKLTLQPIVENALLHGIRKSRNKRGTIRIRAYLEESDLILCVSDDGMGMEEHRAKMLLEESPSTREADGGGSSYGLFNVNERIKLFSGESYGLSICTQPGNGTIVTVRLRAIQEE